MEDPMDENEVKLSNPSSLTTTSSKQNQEPPTLFSISNTPQAPSSIHFQALRNPVIKTEEVRNGVRRRSTKGKSFEKNLGGSRAQRIPGTFRHSHYCAQSTCASSGRQIHCQPRPVIPAQTAAQARAQPAASPSCSLHLRQLRPANPQPARFQPVIPTHASQAHNSSPRESRVESSANSSPDN
ncbi:hypothetical protein TIFTF001_042490 [Ficus carica]|uniref:Uncharacterized protein n=1 Tax=Ficus carica TaxID=3494 RepID=A0AA87ZMF5_FICCA|nr:hypothetical protein TIFTF001_042490 [Ficus carica]